jgi:uncharacterized protein (TIGR00290 family)
MRKILFCWSGGKDSALALWEAVRSKQYGVAALLTTVTRDYDRISMHGVRKELLEKQTASIGLPLEIVWIGKNSSNDDYEWQMQEILLKYKARRISTVAFGDLFLEDVRKYREEQLSKVKMKAIFPLWGKDTMDLARSFIRAGFKAVITCVDTKTLDASFAGRDFNEGLLADLPTGVDPCGENGEFHSFVYDGPLFKKPVLFSRGEKVIRDERFYFCDLAGV